MQKLRKKVNGITLIALVVTIIVLLILAGIAINLTVGNNGLFSRAGNVANTWKQAGANEQEEMQGVANTYDTLKNLELDGSNSSVLKPVEEITGEELENTEVVDKNGDKAYVPAGFIVDTENNTVADGLVVIDKNGGNTDTVGNEFVWVPCTIDEVNNTLKYDIYAFTRDDWTYRQTKLEEKYADESYKIQREDNTSYYYHEAMSEQERTSIEKHGGFYIGRYEVGTDNARRSNTGTTDVARIKTSLPVYNYITRDEAVTIAERMYEGKSKLCSSYAWDTALKYIDGETGTWSVNSEGGNYAGNGGLKNTGYHKTKNIYDIGGNVWEWTTETSTRASFPCVYRGGSYYGTFADGPAGDRSYSAISSSMDDIGLRITLYM